MIADDPASFADKVCFLLENPQKCAGIGMQARKLAERKYGIDSVWQKWQDIYDGIFPREPLPLRTGSL